MCFMIYFLILQCRLLIILTLTNNVTICSLTRHYYVVNLVKRVESVN